MRHQIELDKFNANFSPALLSEPFRLYGLGVLVVVGDASHRSGIALVGSLNGVIIDEYEHRSRATSSPSIGKSGWIGSSQHSVSLVGFGIPLTPS